ncbi:gamma-glutamylcyclotransferase family protein [Pseudomonas sp. W2-17]|uniref:gamma-glutamylcyclotransferase family protein n=1 Tax=Pseudomonas sp. W2-17 TaxID=3058039 RepID=UPI0034E0720E
MNDSIARPVLLFSYGTLQDKAVQLANFGRELVGDADHMLGYSQSWVEITDAEVLAASGKTHHPIIAPSDVEDQVAGTVFQITEQELAAADAYEVADYKRVSVALASGLTAWVYIQA